MDVALHDILRKCSNEDSKEYTHVTTFGPAGKWCINDGAYESFWKKYCEIAEDPGNNKKKLCLAEVQRKHMPIIADLNLKFHPLKSEINEDMEPYEEDFILSIVYCYQQIIKETLKVSESGIELICCVLKAETILEDNLIVCRIRLQFPYCKTVAQIQNRLIRPLVLQMIRQINVVSRLFSQPVNEWEDIIDPLSVEKPVIMYGSSSTPNSPKLVLEYILHETSKEDIENNKMRLMEPEETFFPQNHEHAANGIVSLEMFEDDEGFVDREFLLPYFLSIYYVKEITLPKGGSSNANEGPKKLKVSNNNSIEEDYDSSEYLTTVFLGMLNKKRADEEHYWLDVGKALYNSFSASQRGLEKWMDFTEISDKRNPEDCRKNYYNFLDVKLTVKTLAFYAREDSFNEYNKWHKKWYFPSLEKATSCTHSDVAEAIYRVYWLEFACSNLSKNTMYHFKNHIWKRLDSGHTLKTNISGDFLTIIEKFRTDVAIQIQETNDQNFKDSAEIMIQKICKMISKLKNRTFKSSIFSECGEKFYIEKFEETLDSNSDLMGMTNGIIQVLEKKAVVRDGKPEDFVSRTTGLMFRHDINENHYLYKKLISYLQKVFPDKALLNHFGKMMGATLKGKNVDKIFPIHTGKGNNSKSMIKKLIECAFGEYCITFPTSIFTSSKSNGSAEPAIARSKFAHIAFAQEPDADVPLKSGIIKEMTGGDRFFARFLHDNGGEIAPMFTLILMCNTIPIIPQCDQAIKNRVKCIPYLSEWTKNPPKNPDDQYKERKFLMDPFFEKQLPELAPALMFYLIKMYKVYIREGVSDPEIVQKTTASYWEDNDIYGQFVKENLEKSYKEDCNKKGGKMPDETCTVSLPDLYKRFKDWFKDNHSDLKLPSRSILKGELESRVGKCLNRNFYGIKFKTLTILEA
jgi:phage/plasmid-associated DNA primase